MSSRATLPGWTAPFRSQPTMFRAPCACNKFDDGGACGTDPGNHDPDLVVRDSVDFTLV